MNIKKSILCVIIVCIGYFAIDIFPSETEIDIPKQREPIAYSLNGTQYVSITEREYIESMAREQRLLEINEELQKKIAELTDRISDMQSVEDAINRLSEKIMSSIIISPTASIMLPLEAHIRPFVITTSPD